MGQRLAVRPGFVGMDSRCGQGSSSERASAVRLYRVNTHFMLISEMPHGGQKLSGYGKDMSMYGPEDYTVVRHVMIKH